MKPRHNDFIKMGLFYLLLSCLLICTMYGADFRAKIANPNPDLNDQFGSAVSVSGKYFVIGAPDDDRVGPDAGVVYVYDVNTAALLHTLENPDPAPEENFGLSVSVVGENILIGAPYDNTGAQQSGIAYLFDAISGNLRLTFENPAPALLDFFGFDVSLTNNFAFISTNTSGPNQDSEGFVYQFDIITGTLINTFSSPSPSPSEGFGTSIAVYENSLLVGAVNGINLNGQRAGLTYLFDTNTGNLVNTFFNPTPNTSDFFGRSVAISGLNAVIGASFDDTGADNTGSAYLFNTATGSLVHTFNNPGQEILAAFGNSVAIYDTTILVGAIRASVAYLFSSNSGELLSTPLDQFPDEFFGGSVSIHGDNIILGATGSTLNSTRVGAAYLYTCSTDPTPTEDNISPHCQVVDIDQGPPVTITIEVQDQESGLSHINILKSKNADVSIPSFAAGTNEPLYITATKIDQNKGSTVVLEVFDVEGNSQVCDPVYTTLSTAIPENFILEQNYPNPFNPATTINLSVLSESEDLINVSLKVYNSSGQLLKTLISEPMSPGRYAVEWDGTSDNGRRVASGVYFYNLIAGEISLTRKMLLVE